MAGPRELLGPAALVSERLRPDRSCVTVWLRIQDRRTRHVAFSAYRHECVGLHVVWSALVVSELRSGTVVCGPWQDARSHVQPRRIHPGKWSAGRFGKWGQPSSTALGRRRADIIERGAWTPPTPGSRLHHHRPLLGGLDAYLEIFGYPSRKCSSDPGPAAPTTQQSRTQELVLTIFIQKHYNTEMPITILKPAPVAPTGAFLASSRNQNDSASESDSDGGADVDGDVAMGGSSSRGPNRRARTDEDAAIVTPGEIITEDSQWMR